MFKKMKVSLVLMLMVLVTPQIVFAMHIMEGFLPLWWCLLWGILSTPFIILGIMSIKKTIAENPKIKMLLGLAGAFVFVLSALKLPSVTGSCSHPTGIGLGAILFGAPVMSVLGLIVLLFQALLLAHGGITTLGANTFSMAVVGSLTSVGVYRLVKRLGGKQPIAVFLAAAIGNLATYVTTSIQLAMAFPSNSGGFLASLAKFTGIFAVTQIPLAISEGILTVIIFNILSVYSRNELKDLRFYEKEVQL